MTLQDAKSFSVWLAAWAWGIFCILMALEVLPLFRDDSDPPGPGRSGLTPMKDAERQRVRPAATGRGLNL